MTPAIPHLSIYPNDTKTLTQKRICTPMFTEALFTKNGDNLNIHKWINR